MATAKNVTHRVEGRKLVIEVDLDKNLGPSKTGKSEMVARAMFVPVEHEGLLFTLSAFRVYEDGRG